MGFSFRSFFGKGGSGHGTAEAPVRTMQPPVNMNVPASPFQIAPGTGESPFANSLLFKTHNSAEQLGQPVQAAPFNPFTPADAGASAGLTVGDILPRLPADVSKNPDLSPLQTIALPEAVLQNVQRSGRALVSIFELYKACPEMFQMPVSPHDPREVPLPPGKILQLLQARAHQSDPSDPPGNVAAPALPTNANPFGFGAHLAAAQQSPVSPFGMGANTPAAATPVEPIYQPSPFGIATSQHVEAIPDALQGSTALQAENNPLSANPFFAAPAMTPSSPFTIAQAPPLEAHTPEVSPFGAPPSVSASHAHPAFGFGDSPNPFSPAGVSHSPVITENKKDDSQGGAHLQPPALQQKNVEGFFGQVAATDEPAKLESPKFGAPVPSKIDPAIDASGGFFSATPASPPQPAPSASVTPAFGFGATADINPFFSAPPADKFSTSQLPPVPAMGSEFGIPAQSEKPVEVTPVVASPVTTTLTNPFARIQALAKSRETASASPLATTSAARPEPPAFGGGFLNSEPLPAPAEPEPLLGKSNASIFESLGLPTLGARDQVSETAKETEAPKASEPEVIKLGLAASLKNCAADDLGTSPEHIPSWVNFSLPVDPIRGQLATGRVTVPFSTILEGLEPEVRGIFAKARPALMVELATNEVFHALTGNTTLKAETDTLVSNLETENTFAQPIDPFAAPAKTEWKEAPVNKEAESRFWADLPTAAVPSTLFTLAKQESFTIETKAPAFSEVVPQDNKVEARPEVFIPANQATGIPEFKTVAPLPPRSATVRSEPVGNSNETRRLMLAVLLGTSDVPDVGTFATLTRQLPGVSAVLCLHDDRVVAADGDETCEAERFLREAPLKMRMLPSLTALTGIEDTETLHIQSGQGEATFCLQGSVTFAVLHDPLRREPVLKEKITLLGRELAAMLRDNPPA